jgi:hypothetical protein
MEATAAASAPSFDRDGLRAPGGVERPAMVQAKAAGLEADHRGRGRDPVRLDGKLEALEALDIGSTPEENGCAHACGSSALLCAMHSLS